MNTTMSLLLIVIKGISVLVIISGTIDGLLGHLTSQELKDYMDVVGSVAKWKERQKACQKLKQDSIQYKSNGCDRLLTLGLMLVMERISIATTSFICILTTANLIFYICLYAKKIKRKFNKIDAIFHLIVGMLLIICGIFIMIKAIKLDHKWSAKTLRGRKAADESDEDKNDRLEEHRRLTKFYAKISAGILILIAAFIHLVLAFFLLILLHNHHAEVVPAAPADKIEDNSMICDSNNSLKRIKNNTVNDKNEVGAAAIANVENERSNIKDADGKDKLDHNNTKQDPPPPTKTGIGSDNYDENDEKGDDDDGAMSSGSGKRARKKGSAGSKKSRKSSAKSKPLKKNSKKNSKSKGKSLKPK